MGQTVSSLDIAERHIWGILDCRTSANGGISDRLPRCVTVAICGGEAHGDTQRRGPRRENVRADAGG